MNSIPESAKMEEGGFVDEAVPSTRSSGSTTSTSSTSTAKARSRLSTVSKQYDIDGDGELDDAELASKWFCLLIWYDVYNRLIWDVHYDVHTALLQLSTYIMCLIYETLTTLT